MTLKFETILQIFRKIIQLNVVNILESTNEYYRKIIEKSGKMDLYPAMGSFTRHGNGAGAVDSIFAVGKNGYRTQ